MERKLLNPGQTLALFRLDSGAAAVWRVTGHLGSGGSCVCYSAKSGMKSGRLKEFYPLDDLGRPLCHRDTGGKLTFSCPDVQRGALQQEFLHAYRLLEQAKEDAPAARILNNFIPPYELLCSRDQRGEIGTLYVWTPDDKEGVSFESYLCRVWEDPEHAPEHKLYNILSTVLTLTDCIRILHRAGLRHLDIRPANFLVLYDGQFNINPASISLFDINTLHSSADGNSRLAGTEGYCAPEVYQGRACNQSDIFSIGAMLLRAVTGAHWQQEQYAMLDALVADSALIRASESNSNVFLRHNLSRVLKKCLAGRPAERYSCCEELITELRGARAYLLPEVESEHLGLGKRLAVLDAEDATHQSSAAVLHDLLFRHPLDTPDGRDIRVLVVGAGTYGQKFIDICLQAGQMLGRKLRIRAVSQNPELDREVYLQIRPALHRFVNCDGSGCGECDARLDFDPMPVAFRKGDAAGNRKAVARLLGQYAGALPGYVFVALGDDELNARIASQIARLLRTQQVHFVVQGKRKLPPVSAHPVYINTPLTARAIDPALEQMAFNAHLCWMDAPNGDLRLARSGFQRKYNLEASLAYALSVGSKLRSVGIYEKDPRKAAALFREKLLDADAEVLERLAALEHRRWVMDKITAGWRCPETEDGRVDLLTGILRGSMKDKTGRTHPCIVSCRPGRKLQRYTRQQWDEPNPGDEELDELDRVSLEQHRLCREQAARLRDRQPLGSGDPALLRRSLAGAPEEVRRAFGRYQLCLSRILGGSHADAREFDGCETALKKALSCLPRVQRDGIIQRMNRLRRDFFPAIESCLYRDYKLSDEALIRQIPFVLTNRPCGTLLTVLRDDAVANVAAAMVLRPRKVIYLCRGGNPAAMLERILDCFENRGLRCRVEACVTGQEVPELAALKQQRAQFNYRLLSGDSPEYVIKALSGKKIDLFDRTAAEDALEELAVKYPSFRFAPAEGTFTDCRGCEQLTYLPGGAYLRLEDLDALWGTAYGAAPAPEYGPEEGVLWQLYRDREEIWNRLCRKAAAQAREGDLLWTMTEAGPKREITRLFPAYLYEMLAHLLQLLLHCGAAEPESVLEADTSDACRLRLVTRCTGAETLLSSLYRVENWQSLEVRNENGDAQLCWDDMQLRALPVEEEELPILEKLLEMGLISDLIVGDGKAAFRFSAPRVKKLLTRPGRLGRLAAWQKLRQEECFDDGACLEDGFLLIRGFRVLQIPWIKEEK